MKRAVTLVALAASGCGGGDPGVTASASGSGAIASATAVVGARAVPKARCEIATLDEHLCWELDDAELASERERSCPGKFERDKACPSADLIGACRLPEGSLRMGYPPKPAAWHERACKELQGRYAAGTATPAADAVTFVSCDGKYEGVCEDEEVHVAARVPFAAEECRTFGGTHRVGVKCSRDDAEFTCDLPGKKTLVGRSPTAPEAKKRFCEERSGALRDLAPAVAAGSSSAGAPVDEDPPEPKPEVVIRHQ